MMQNYGKRILRRVLFTAALLAGLLLFSAACAEDWMAEARRMLTLLNDFRTGSETWCWDKTDTKKEYATGLAPMAYDLELEKVAMVRAQELAVKMSHTRPDGSKWSTAFPAGKYSKAENIARGYRSAEETFTAFKEEFDSYSGQGHRRIMLKKELTRVGFAAVEVDGVVYWVQEFASGKVVSPLVISSGWSRENGVYYYIREDGSKAAGWLEDQDRWYYLDASGAMQTGWQKIGGKWYLFSDSGAMQTGWQKTGGEWYYFATDGAMQTGWQKIGGKWYLFSDSGVMLTGWQKTGGKWYLFSDSGVMLTGWQKTGGKWYYLSDSGVMQTDWQKVDGKWYYFASNGVMQTGWKELGSQWYYFKSSGEMVTGTVTINGQKEIFDASGVWKYSEIPDYETPLGGFPLTYLVQMLIRFLQSILPWA